jgi:hypothetical protein
MIGTPSCETTLEAVMAANPEDWTPNGHDHRARATPGNRSLLPEYLVEFLEILRHTGNVSLSSRRIGWSRSTIYAFAAKNPSFREAMREALTEGRELLLGEAWKRATQWTELRDDNGKILQRTPPSDRLLAILVAGYFQEFKPGRGDDVPADALLPETADLTQLEDHELETLERILVKAGADDLGTRAD